MIKSIFFLLFLIIFSDLPSNDDIGTQGFNFLNNIISARYRALGHSLAGRADDETAVLVNPAALNNLDSVKIGTNYMSYFDGFNGGSVFILVPSKAIDENMSENFGFGAGVQYLGKFNIPRRDSEGNSLGEFSAGNLLLALGGGVYLNPQLNLGLNMKFLTENLDDRNASAIAFDIALEHQTTNENLVLGVIVKNIGKQLSYYTSDEYEEKMPLTGVAGFSYDFNGRAFLNLDIVKPFNDDNIYWSTGFEFMWNDYLTLRGGFKPEFEDWKTGDSDFMAGMSFGFGINWQRYNFDFGLESFGDLGFVNLIGIKYNF